MDEYLKLFVRENTLAFYGKALNYGQKSFFTIFFNRAVQRTLAEGEDHILARQEQEKML
jgi:hypothetical protein